MCSPAIVAFDFGFSDRSFSATLCEKDNPETTLGLGQAGAPFAEAGAPPLTLAWHAVTEERPYNRLQIGSCSASATADGANNSHGRARAGRSSVFFLSLRKPLAGPALPEPFKASTADRRGGGECGP